MTKKMESEGIAEELRELRKVMEEMVVVLKRLERLFPPFYTFL